ncbi:heavy-metal-associated domain-containing protein, partial [Frankia sp. AiPs1]|nr:heavy-metal-associated domain-containing protein [Frankia sp. AiPs1]
MTCSSCAARVERKLNRIDGVSASVNYATEKATITLARAAPAGAAGTGSPVTVDELIGAVQAAGYTANLPAAAMRPPAGRGRATATATATG